LQIFSEAPVRYEKAEIATIRKDIDIFAGWINRFENPDPILATESSGKGLKLYDEVVRDAHAGSVLQTRILSVTGREWEVIPADDTPRSEEIADFIRNACLAVNFDQFRQELLMGILYGFFCAEIMWEGKNGSMSPSHIMSKHPKRFVFTPERELRLLTLANLIEGEPVPDRKFIVFTWGSSDNPYGSGLGQKLWWPVWFKKHGVKFWLVFLEKFGMPTAVGKYPAGTSPEQQQALLDAIEAIQQDTGIRIPDTMAVNLLEASRTGNVTYEALCNYMDRQISKAVLGQTASTEGTPGKLGNEDSQDKVRMDIVKADADLLSECLNNTLVRWLTDLNFGPVPKYPRMWIRVEEVQDLKALAERDKTIAVDMGMARRIPESYIAETYGIPLAEEGDAVMMADEGKIFEYHFKYGTITVNEVRARLGLPPVAGGEKLIVSESPGQAPAFSEAGRPRFSQADADLIAGTAARMSDQAIETLLAPVLKAVSRAETFEDVGEAIYAIYPHLDMETFQELLARAMFSAGLAGAAAVEGAP